MRYCRVHSWAPFTPKLRKYNAMLQLFSVPDNPSLLAFGVFEPRFVLLPCVFPGPESFARHRAGEAGCVPAASSTSLARNRHHP